MQTYRQKQKHETCLGREERYVRKGDENEKKSKQT